MRFEKIYNRSLIVTKRLQKIELVIGMICLAFMLSIIVLNIVFRYVLYKPISWSDELSNYLFIWMSFLASAYVMGDDHHVRVTALVQRMPAKPGNFIHLTMNLVMLTVFASYIVPSLSILGGLKRSNMMRIPLKFVYVIIPIAFFLMAVHVINNIIRDLYRIANSKDTTGPVKSESLD